METTPLQNLDQAKALVDCFYATYGLTFHRSYVYDPQELLELNRDGSFISFIAMEHGRVLGHLGIFQPFYELFEDGVPITDPATREVGLSIVSPEARRRGVQASLGLTMHKWARDNQVEGAYMKCVTHHTFSQRSAFASGGTPVALYLGGVPRWIVYERDPSGQADPISTMVFYVPVRRQEAQPIALTPRQSWLWDHIRATRIVRYQADPTATPPRPTKMIMTWQGDRRVAFIHVLQPGTDLEEVLNERIQWLLGGHIEHVSVYIPAADPYLAECADRLGRIGLFLGGWIPSFYRGRRDVLVYQVLAPRRLDPDNLQVHGEMSRMFKDRVFHEWTAAVQASGDALAAR